MRAATLALLALACLPALAGAQNVTVTEAPVTSYQLFDAKGTKVGNYDSLEACKAAAPVGPPPGVVSSCRPVIKFTKVGTCDATAPPWPVKVDPDGFLLSPELRVPVRADGSWGPTEVQAMVPGPGFPDCWVEGWVRYVGQDMQPDPDRVAYVDNPADLAPEPLHCDEPGADLGACIEPGYDEHDPVGGQPGPPGAVTVDKPG